MWNFGDGSSAAGAAPAHVFGGDGTFNVTLTVTDRFGNSGVVTHPITIDRPPVAAFTDVPAGAGIPTTFSAAGSSDPDGTIASYSWNFGDLSGASGPVASHAYSTPGTYNATLTVTDNSGSTAAVTQAVVIVRPNPTAQQSIVTTSLSKIAKGGLVVNFAVNEPGTVRGDLILPNSTAASLGLHGRSARKKKSKGVIVGTATVHVARPGNSRLVIHLSKSTIAKLKRRAPVTVTVRITFTDPTGRKTQTSSNARLRR